MAWANIADDAAINLANVSLSDSVNSHANRLFWLRGICCTYDLFQFMFYTYHVHFIIN